MTNLFAIGVVNRSRMDVYFVANRKMKNIPKQIIDDVSFYHPASFFFE